MKKEMKKWFWYKFGSSVKEETEKRRNKSQQDKTWAEFSTLSAGVLVFVNQVRS